MRIIYHLQTGQFKLKWKLLMLLLRNFRPNHPKNNLIKQVLSIHEFKKSFLITYTQQLYLRAKSFSSKISIETMKRCFRKQQKFPYQAPWKRNTLWNTVAKKCSVTIVLDVAFYTEKCPKKGQSIHQVRSPESTTILGKHDIQVQFGINCTFR